MQIGSKHDEYFINYDAPPDISSHVIQFMSLFMRAFAPLSWDIHQQLCARTCTMWMTMSSTQAEENQKCATKQLRAENDCARQQTRIVSCAVSGASLAMQN